MSLYQAQTITPNYFLSVNSAGEIVQSVPVASIATNAYVDAAIAALIGLAPSDLDTLQEIAADLNLKQTKLLTGYVVGSNAAILDTDNVLQGFGKAQAQITANVTATAAAVADIATINTTLGTVVYLSSSQSITGIKSFTQVIKADGGLDVTATGGSDVLNIGTSNADIINIGWSGAQVVFQGSVFRNQVTNVYVTDKLATYNAGGAAASGYSVGFEIEENAIITGYFATNGSRDGWDFKAPGITDYLTLSLIGLSAHRTLTAPNQSGTIVVTTDLASYLALTGGTMSGDILMGSHDIKNVGSIYDGSTIAAAISTRLLKDSSGNTIVNWQSRTNGLGIGTGAGYFGYFKTTNVTTGIATLEFPDGSGTIARTSDLTSYLPLVGGTLTGLISFSGTTHAGIQLNSLTTTQRDALTASAGMVIWNSTTSRYDFHNGASWKNHVRLDGDTWTGSMLPNATNSLSIGSNSLSFANIYSRIMTVDTPAAVLAGTADTAGNNLSLYSSPGTGSGAQSVNITSTIDFYTPIVIIAGGTTVQSMVRRGSIGGIQGSTTGALWLGSSSPTQVNYAIAYTADLTYQVASGGSHKFKDTAGGNIYLLVSSTALTSIVPNSFNSSANSAVVLAIRGFGAAGSYTQTGDLQRWQSYDGTTATTRLKVDANFKLTLVASAATGVNGASAGMASLNIPAGVAPTTPADGDIWFDGTNIKMRIGGSTKTFTLT